MRPSGFTSLWFLGLLTLGALACSPSPGTVDGGTSGDGGSGRAIGAACRQNADCASQSCDTRLSGGYCIASCGGNNSCPTHASCSTTPEGQTACLASCMKNTDCRLGYVCDPHGRVCLPSGQSPGGNDGGSTTRGSSDIGGACSSGADCAQGSTPECLATPGGYCTSACTTDTDCGSNGACVGVPDGSGGTSNICFEKCTTTPQCGRAGYVCVPLQQQGGPGVCYPACASDMDCGPGAMCDTSSGQCVARTSPPDGGYPGYPAAFPSPPQVTFHRGPVMATPRIIPIFFSNADMTVVQDMGTFYSKLGGSMFWAVAKEYGVGAATSVTPIVLNERAAASVDDSQVSGGLQSWLQNEISIGNVPQPGANSIYIVHYPAGTTITDGSGQSCQAFNGYHSEMQLGNGSEVPYAVIPTCPAPAQSGLTPENMYTIAASHELIESSTNPFPSGGPAWAGLDAAHAYWMLFDPGGEVGDMCENDPEAFAEYQDLPYVVQRFWSNKAAAAGHDPCEPLFPGDIYFNSVPEMSDSFAINVGNGNQTVRGVRVGVGQSKTIPLDLYSDEPTGGPWSVQVMDGNQLQGGQATISFSLDKTMGQNGDKLMLTIKPMQAGQGGYDLFFVISTLGSGQSQIVHLWPGIIAD